MLLRLCLHWLIVAASMLVAARLVPGVRIGGWRPALLGALVLGALNIFLKPLLFLLTLPLTILSFGLFLVVLNALIISLVSYLVRGFEVRGFWAALFASFIISFGSAIGDEALDRLLPHHRHRLNDTYFSDGGAPWGFSGPQPQIAS